VGTSALDGGVRAALVPLFEFEAEPEP